MDPSEKNPSNLDASQLSVNGNQLRYRGNVHYLRGTNAYAARPYHWSFNDKTGSYGNGDDTNLPLSMKFSTNARTIRFVKQYYDEASPAGFANAFNCIRNPVSPLIFDAQRAAAAGLTETQRLAEWNRLNAYADQCALEGIWLMVCPYGMGFFGDYPERRIGETVAADVNNPDRDAQNHVAVTGAVTSTLVSMRKWMMYRADNAMAVGHILINTLNEPRRFEATGDDQKWFGMQSAWIAALRDNTDTTQQPYEGPIFVDGHQWANNLFVPKARSLALQDSNIVFLSHRYANQPSTVPIYGNKTEWSDFKEAATGVHPVTGQTSAIRLCVGVGEMGPSHEGAHLKPGVTSGDEFSDSAAMQEFVDEYVEDLFIDPSTPIPVFLLWMVLHDPSSIFGYHDTTGVSPVLTALYPDHYGANPDQENPDAFIYDDQYDGEPKLNKWAKISRHAFAKSLEHSSTPPAPDQFAPITLDLSEPWNAFGAAVGVNYDAFTDRMRIAASGTNMLNKGAKEFPFPVSTNKVYRLAAQSNTNTGRLEFYPGNSVNAYETDIDGNRVSSNALRVFVDGKSANEAIYFRVVSNRPSFYLQVQSDNVTSPETLLMPAVAERLSFVPADLAIPAFPLSLADGARRQPTTLRYPRIYRHDGVNMRLSENFYLSEFERSEFADLNGLDNSIPTKYIGNIQRLVDEILQPLRDQLGLPIVISSGYRSKAVNTGVGGVKNSAHLRGLAADIYSPSITAFDMTETIIRSGLPFDKIIQEFGKWTHVRVARQNDRPARVVMTAYKTQKGKAKFIAGNWPLRDSRLV